MTFPISQVSCIGEPEPRTWDDFEGGCMGTFRGGHDTPETVEAFQHGMATVFNLLRAEFPPAEQCKAAPDLLAACEAYVYGRKEARECEAMMRAAITKATPPQPTVEAEA